MKPANTDRSADGPLGYTSSGTSIDQIHLDWQGNRMPVLAMDKLSFVADASALPEGQFLSILKTSSEQAAEPIGHSATLVGGGYGRVPIDFFVLENHKSLLRCQFGELISQEEGVLDLIQADVSRENLSQARRIPAKQGEKSALEFAAEAERPRKRGGKKIRNTLVGGSLATLAVLGLMNRGETGPSNSNIAFTSASVSTNNVDVEAPVDGRLQTLLVEVGDTVVKGQVVAQLRPLVDTAGNAELEGQIGQLNNELSIIEKAKSDLAEAIQFARRDAQLKVEEGQAYLDELTAESDAWEAKMVRLQPLIADGTISEAEGTQLRSELEGARSAVIRQTRAMERIRLANTAADRDILITRDGVTPVVELDSKIALVSSQIDDLRKRASSSEASAGPIELKASANGVIESVDVTVGETVLAGRRAIGVKIADPSMVMALIPFDSGDSVAVGDKVDVKLTRLGIESAGTVQGIEPSAENGDVMITKIQLDAGNEGLKEALPNESVEVALTQ